MILKKIILFFFGGKRTLSKDLLSVGAMSSVLFRPVGDAIGDAVVEAAMIRQIRIFFPKSRLGVFVTDRNISVFKASDLKLELIPDTYVNYLKNRHKWNVFLDSHNSFTSANLFKDWLLDPRIKVIFNKAEKKYYNIKTVRNYDYYCSSDKNNYVGDSFNNSIISESFKLPKLELSLNIPADLLNSVKSNWKEGKIKVLLAPQGSFAWRKIPADYLAKLLQKINDKFKLHTQFLLSNGSSESEAYFQELIDNCEDRSLDVFLGPKTDLEQYMALVASCDLIIAIDSGSVHLACALKRPLLAFYANDSGNIGRWHPYHHQEIPTKMIVSQNPEGVRSTDNFPLSEPSEWLNLQISNLCHQLIDLNQNSKY